MVHSSIVCDRHSGNQVKFYCDTCEVPICSDCTVIDHRSPEHKHRYLQDAAGEYKQFVEMTITQLKTKEKENDDSTQAVQKMVTKLDATFHEEEKKLQDHMTETIKEITKRIEENGRQLLKQLRDEYKARKDELTAQLKAFEIVEHDLAYTREFTENLIRYGSDAQLMSAKRNIVSQTKQLLNIETKCDPVAGEFMVFRPSDDYFERKSLGKVQLTEYTLEDVPEFLRTGDDVCVALEVKGREDVSVDKISSEIIDPTNKKETMTVEDHKNGTFSLRCRVKIEGDHKMTVSVCKQLVYSSYVKVISKKGLLFRIGKKSASKEGLNQPCGWVP
ncbi:E3 ubiquitin-protein ligase TRIM71-like [Ptychodera flava]|uniref:E3 ubiquitin-protein ligase TRIM71-like n=1 Tax=Ptychodera flava TaxID=63121 RepID=UPI00396A436B